MVVMEHPYRVLQRIDLLEHDLFHVYDEYVPYNRENSKGKLWSIKNFLEILLCKWDDKFDIESFSELVVMIENNVILIGRVMVASNFLLL